MTKDKALRAWFSQFLPAYPASNVPEDAVFPWLTYELVTGSWDSGMYLSAVKGLDTGVVDIPAVIAENGGPSNEENDGNDDNAQVG